MVTLENKQSQVRRKQMTPEDRERIVSKVLAGLSIKDISVALDMNYKTVWKIATNFLKTGDVHAKPCGGDRRSKLTLEQKNNICLARHRLPAKA
ncbi:hypothetical protein HERIO_1575 [Hepatospora eriocheir]|uniref:Uncharacterized protein n=1 Tax=Hepatospora eriocheir TaxID=1081669 RepID=A0A1X0Q9Q2_9MICR|nr:hypothetical protein HERIO_1575 [Hepatospora eriocheir]